MKKFLVCLTFALVLAAMLFVNVAAADEILVSAPVVRDFDHEFVFRYTVLMPDEWSDTKPLDANSDVTVVRLDHSKMFFGTFNVKAGGIAVIPDLIDGVEYEIELLFDAGYEFEETFWSGVIGDDETDAIEVKVVEEPLDVSEGRDLG